MTIHERLPVFLRSRKDSLNPWQITGSLFTFDPDVLAYILRQISPSHENYRGFSTFLSRGILTLIFLILFWIFGSCWKQKDPVYTLTALQSYHLESLIGFNFLLPWTPDCFSSLIASSLIRKDCRTPDRFRARAKKSETWASLILSLDFTHGFPDPWPCGTSVCRHVRIWHLRFSWNRAVHKMERILLYSWE